MGAGNREGIGLSYRSAGLHRLAESIPGLLEIFMYLRAIFCTFQISVDFYFVPVGGRGGGRGGLEKGRGLERGG
jgi:hypothetical protein